MKIQPLYDLQQEINRLFIAGSKFSKDDPRLLKQVPVFNKLGEKAPVFKKLAADIEALANADSQESATKLLGISTLLYSVLYTQGATVEEAHPITAQQPSFSLEAITTAHTYATLKPVIEALTQSNSGRLEVLKEAAGRSVFSDFRLFHYLDGALADKYGELADYVAATLIPMSGKSIRPFLYSSFRYEDKTEHVRRLHLLYQLEHPGIGDMIEQIFSGNLPQLQAAAIHILSNDPNNESLIIKLADDKNKIVREAAYKALAGYDTASSLERLTEAYLANKNSGLLPGIVNAIAQSKLPFFFTEVVTHFDHALETLITAAPGLEDKILTGQLDQICIGFRIFENKGRKEAYELFNKFFLNDSLNQTIRKKQTLLQRTAEETTHNIIHCLYSFPKEHRLRYYSELIPQLKNPEWQAALYTAYLATCIQNEYSSEKIYTTFAGMFQKGLIPVDDLYRRAFPNDRGSYYDPDHEGLKKVNTGIFDKKWIVHFYDRIQATKKWNYETTQLMNLLHAFEPADSKAFYKLLVTTLESQELPLTENLFYMLMDRRIPERFTLIYNSLSRFKHGSTYFYSNTGRASFWKQFRKEYAASIRILYEKQKLSFFNEIADRIEYQ